MECQSITYDFSPCLPPTQLFWTRSAITRLARAADVSFFFPKESEEMLVEKRQRSRIEEYCTHSSYNINFPSWQSEKRLEPNPAGLRSRESHEPQPSRGNDHIPSGQPKPLETPLKKTHEAWDQKLNDCLPLTYSPSTHKRGLRND